MFSPGAKRSNYSSRKDRNPPQAAAPDSPLTPLPHNSIPNRPTTGTPAPWAPRLSVLARIPPASKSEKGDDVDPTKPVYVGEFPQVVRDEQASFLRRHMPGDAVVTGGMDKETCLSWIICGNRLFLWSYLSSAASKKCVVLEIPSIVSGDVDIVGKNACPGSGWLVCIVNWDRSFVRRNQIASSCNSAAIVLCNQKTRSVAYWHDIFYENGSTAVTSVLPSDELEVNSFSASTNVTPNRQRQRSRTGSRLTGWNPFNSMIASPVPASQQECVALVCNSSGELWRLHCSPNGIRETKVYQDIMSSSSQGNDNSGQVVGCKGYPRSLIWRFSTINSSENSNRQFFLLTDREIQCFSIVLHTDLNVSKLWSHEIVGTDGDSGIKKDLAGQKRIWPLDVQVDDHGKVITVLVATFCKDRGTSSNYTQYSLLTMQYNSRVNVSSEGHERVLEKKAPIQVIIPKARVEDEDFLFSMRVRVGGKPSGSTLILSGDGTATVSHYRADSTRLYQFDLPYDAGKVLDASILPSTDDDEGAWVVLTEKAGIWAIPDKAVVVGGVEPPERSLSRKGSSNEGSAQEERRNLAFSTNIVPRRLSSEARDAGDRQRAVSSGLARRTAQDEESEALLGQLFHDFLLSGKADGAFERLNNSGAFEREGETNVFARTSKSIVDTLAKHWTTTRGAEILTMGIVYNQLMDKQQKHQRFLQFLALSKCHEELCSKQRHSLQLILEHGEKLAGIIQLREMQNTTNRLNSPGPQYSSSEAHASGALWDLIQLVGDRARRNTVLLMDRENAEVFYSKVSDLEEVFYCLEGHLQYLVLEEQPLQPLEVQVQRVCELSTAIVSIIRTSMLYRNEHHMWYPPPEGLTPWYCQAVVRNGLWGVASFMLQLLNKASGIDIYTPLHELSDVLLEAYSGAITAKLERGEEQKNLLLEYWNKRDSLLDSLYVRHRDKILSVGTNEESEELLRKLSSSLLSIAKRHEGYNTMWSICYDLNDLVLLRNLMHESMGPKGGFSYFVFKQLYEERQYSKILRLGEEFQEELSIFLKDHRDLMWLHELFLHQFSPASETLHLLALSQDQSPSSEADENKDPGSAALVATMADRKRLLNLSKIAALAGKNADSEAKVKRVEADLKILKLQEEIMKALPPNVTNQYGQQLYRPEELIELCLKVEHPAAALLGFDVFAWTGSSFRRNHRSLLEDCWKNAADHDDWSQLHEASRNEGWSDEETLQRLRETVLFQASSRCYGPEAESFEEGFSEVLPLRKDDLEVHAFKDLDSSVETILMQHKDFPDAGKLMLTAIMLGSVQDDIAAVEEGPTPME